MFTLGIMMLNMGIFGLTALAFLRPGFLMTPARAYLKRYHTQPRHAARHGLHTGQLRFNKVGAYFKVSHVTIGSHRRTATV